MKLRIEYHDGSYAVKLESDATPNGPSVIDGKPAMVMDRTQIPAVIILMIEALEEIKREG